MATKQKYLLFITTYVVLRVPSVYYRGVGSVLGTSCLLQGRRQCLGYQLFITGASGRQRLDTSCLLQGRTVGSVLGSSCLLQGRTVGSVLGTRCLLQGVGSVFGTSYLLQGRRQCWVPVVYNRGIYSRQCLRYKLFITGAVQ